MKNGYFQVVVKPEDGTYLHIVPPGEEDGAPVSSKEATDYLAMKGLMFDIVEIDRAIRRNIEATIKLSIEEPFIEQEMMDIKVSENRMKVTVRFYPPFEGGELMDKEEILGDLAYRKVKFGIKQSVIDDFLANRQYCTDYVIAEGIPVQEAKDAKIEYLFNTDLSVRPTVNEDGSVDYYHLNNICHCHKDDVLARLIPADSGKIGRDVFGNDVKPRVPKNAVFQYGHYIRRSEDNQYLISEIDGHVSLVEDKVFVSNVLDLANVDLSTGNIDFDGSVSVRGNVMNGFTIKATGDVEIDGVVEGAHITAGGQIIIKRGITGMSRGLLEAGSNILCKYIENANVVAGGYVETDCIIHSTVAAKDHVVVQGKKGFITGGVVRAGRYIEAKTLGSELAVDTILEVGVDPEMKKKLNNLKKNLVVLKKDITRLEPVIRALGERLGKGEIMDPEQLRQAKDLSANLAKKKEQLKRDLVMVQKMESEFDQISDAVIKVTGQAYTGTRLCISECNMILKTDYHYCRFVRDGADVIMKPL